MTGQGVRLSTLLRDCVGGRTAKAIETAFGYRTVHELLLHVPRRYVERGQLTDLNELNLGEDVTVVAEVKAVSQRRMTNRRGSILDVVVTDGHPSLTLTFFNQPWLRSKLTVGRRGFFAGKVSEFNRKRQLTNPVCELLPEADEDEQGGGNIQVGQDARAFADSIIPVYPATAAVVSWKIRNCVSLILDQIAWAGEEDPLPTGVRTRHHLVDAASAFEFVHRPSDRSQVQRGLERLRWEEAFALQVVLARRRNQLRDQPAVARRAISGGLLDRFDLGLPFNLTAGQRDVSAVIADELAFGHPMHRLLQGEVGSGKTVVALRAMLAVVDSGGQAVILAPTEVLAAQHFRSIRQLMGPLADDGMLGAAEVTTGVALITGSQSARERRQSLLAAASGQAGIVIGTHALLEDKVQFADLGLVVIDEQHRFGVEQRAVLTTKTQAGTRPHVLVMTATPIPRTVAMTVFGDLEVSTLRELPTGRAGISTHVVPAAEKPTFLTRTWERASEEVRRGRQVYVVCPRIGSEDEVAFTQIVEQELGQSPTIPTASVEQTLVELATGPLAGLRVEALHGRMSGDDKDSVMRRFAGSPTAPAGIDVLVATTVVEVGADVPNATVMIIMDADRFGVSQLHQLRGRIGRGEFPGVCLLVTSAESGSPVMDRLFAVASTTDGFELSQLDLQTRREGDVLGADQSGRKSSLRTLSLLRDESIIVAARDEAELTVMADPNLSHHLALRKLVAELVGPDAADWLDRS